MQTPHFLKENFNISFLSSFKTEAYARYYFDITSYDDILLLPEVLWFAKELGIPSVIIGWWTNCLFAFDTYEGILIRNRYTGYSEPYDHHGRKYILVHSGEVSTSFSLALYQHYSISTLIPWVGLPGTMGGACIGNAWCFGLEMSDILVEAKVLNLVSGEISSYKNKDFFYRYRESILKEDRDLFVIEMILDVSPQEWNEYASYTPADLQALRRLKQPPGFSCGSFFKNPRLSQYQDFIWWKETLTGERGHSETLSAGKLIDDSWLKWKRIGWVHVSERHGNFFINDEKWSWQDILALRDYVQEKVYEKHGIHLHEEVRILTNIQ
jgi:UDP-N-acetylmuramate dehydrogenase